MLLSIVMFASILAGCGNSESNKAAETTTKSAEVATTATTAPVEESFVYTGKSPVVKELTKITWLCTNSCTGDYDWSTKKWIQEMCQKANVEIDMECIDYAVYKDTVLPRIAAGNLPDVVLVPVNDSNMMYANSGKFMDLTSFYDKYGCNIKNDFERNPMLRGQLTTPDGKMYFFPSLVPALTGPVSLIVTQPYVRDLGIQMPTTLTDFKNMLIQFRDKDMNGNGDTADEIPFVFPSLDRVKVFSGMWGIDLSSGFTADKDGKVFYSYTSDQYRTFLTYLNELYKEGLLNEDFVKQSSDTRTNLYANNRVGVSFNFTGNAANYTKTMNKNWNIDKDELDYMPIMPLTGGTDDPYYLGRDSFGERFAINANCKEQTAIAAFSFMDYCMGEEGYLLHNFGHEGESYSIDEKGYIHDIPNEDVSENADKYGSWFKGIPDNEGLFSLYSGPSYDTIVGKISTTATRPPTIVSSYMKEDEINVANKYETDLQTYVDEMLIKFITGNENLQAWDSYVSKCDSLGAKDLVPVKQAIYNRLTMKK